MAYDFPQAGRYATAQPNQRLRMRRRQVQRPTSRRLAMTLVELLLAAMTTAIVCGAAAAMMSGVSNASLATRNLRSQHIAGHYALTQLNRVIRGARDVGKVTSTAVTIWLADANEDDKLNLYETALLRYDSAGKQIILERLESSDKTIPATTVSVAQFTDPAQLGALITGADKKSHILASDVTSVILDSWPKTPEARIVTVDFTIAQNGASAVFNLNASPQAPGDYLFYTQTKYAPAASSSPPRKTRAFHSMYNGFTEHASLSSITLESNL